MIALHPFLKQSGFVALSAGFLCFVQFCYEFREEKAELFSSLRYVLHVTSAQSDWHLCCSLLR